MRKPESVRKELWDMKVRMMEEAVANGGLMLDFTSSAERDSFISYLNNFRATIVNNKQKYQLEVGLVGQLSFIKGKPNQALIVLNKGLNKNDKILIKICNGL